MILYIVLFSISLVIHLGLFMNCKSHYDAAEATLKRADSALNYSLAKERRIKELLEKCK